MQRLRALSLGLTTLLIAVTAIGMERMPVSPPAAALHHDAATPDGHDGDIPQGEGRHQGSDDCLYCQLATATDLPSLDGDLTIHRRLLPRIAGMQGASCHPLTLTLPCRPRAPPTPVTS